MHEPRLHTEHWQDIYGNAQDLGEIWALRKGSRVARCVLQGHPIGTEGRILVDGELISTKAFRDQKTMINETWEWRRAFEEKGWTAQSQRR